MRHRTTICFVICSLALVIIVGCGEDFSLLSETLRIENIEVNQSSVGVGETTAVEAFVSYSGDETVLIYDWSADAGVIGGSGSTTTYIAPSTSGTYFINLKVSDGAVSDEKMVQINVGQGAAGSLTLDFDTHWPAIDHKDKLAYRVNVKSIASGKVYIYYDITQDMDDLDAFLSIEVNQTSVLPGGERAIGADQSTGKRTMDQVDVSHIINVPGWYTISFYIKPGARVENGWLMNEATIIGIQGTSDPLQ